MQLLCRRTTQLEWLRHAGAAPTHERIPPQQILITVSSELAQRTNNMPDITINPLTFAASLEYAAITSESDANLKAFLLLVQEQLRSAGDYSFDRVHIQSNGWIERHSSAVRYTIRAGQRAATISLRASAAASNNDGFQGLLDNFANIRKAPEQAAHLDRRSVRITVHYPYALDRLTAVEMDDTAAQVARAYTQLCAATSPYL